MKKYFILLLLLITLPVFAQLGEILEGVVKEKTRKIAQAFPQKFVEYRCYAVKLNAHGEVEIVSEQSFALSLRDAKNTVTQKHSLQPDERLYCSSLESRLQ